MAYLIHLVPCLTNKTMWTRCLSGFLIYVHQKNDNDYENDKPGEIHQACVLICAPWGSVLKFGNGIRAGKEDQLSSTIAWFDHLRLLHKDSDMPILQSHLYASLCHNWHFCSVTAATVVAGIFETMQSCHHVRAFLYSKWGSEERSFVSQMSLSLRTTLCLFNSVSLCWHNYTQLNVFAFVKKYCAFSQNTRA